MAGRLLITVLILATAATAVADEFLLRNGGKLVGELLNPDESPRQRYIIRTPAGAQLTLEKELVQDVVRRRPVELEYDRVAPTYADTADGQWALAEWCQSKGLLSQRKQHLQRVVELNPDHAEARRLLGYAKIEGRWLTQDEAMKAQGLVLYKGRWRTPQEVEVFQNKDKVLRAEKEWAVKVERWRDQLGTNRDAAARAGLAAIADPHAGRALAAGLKVENRPAVRVLFVEGLARIGTPEAIGTLVHVSLEDPVEEVRLTCFDYLKKRKDAAVVAAYVAELRAKDNVKVNRAAHALAQLGDASVVGPLIDALLTRHQYKIVPAGSGGPGSITTSFGQGGNAGQGGMSVGGGGPKIIEREIRNQGVLNALESLTGVNFDFDVRAWKNWFAAQKRGQEIDARRGAQTNAAPPPDVAGGQVVFAGERLRA